MNLKDKYNPLNYSFKKLFDAAEIAKFSKEEKELYEESLKYYRDIKNVVDTSKAEGKLEEKLEIAKNLKKQGISVDVIAKATGLSESEIDSLS